MSRRPDPSPEPEKQVVIALSRMPVETVTVTRLRAIVSGHVDWNGVMALASRWQVEPAVFGNLRRLFDAELSPELVQQLGDLERTARAHALSATMRLADLVNALAAAGIPAIVLKGPAIAIAAYGDCSRRTFADVDLLLHRSDLMAARDLLVTRGFAPDFSSEMVGALVNGQHALEFSDSRSRVELHWSLLSRHLSFDLDPEELWDRAVEIECAGTRLMALAPHHLFLYLCAHGAKHEWMLFRWLCDVAQLARGLTPSEAQQVVRLAERTHSKRLLALGLRLARETFGEEESPFPEEAYLRADDTEALIAVARSRVGFTFGDAPRLLPRRLAAIHPYAEPLTFWLRSRERTRDRLVCAARFVFAPAPRDFHGGSIQKMLRPARLAVHALRRVVHAS